MRFIAAGSSGGGWASNPRRRMLGTAAAVVSVLGVFAASGLSATPALASPTCVLHSLPSFVAQGNFAANNSVADIVEVGCEPSYAGRTLEVSAEQLYYRCHEHLSWSSPYPYAETSGPSVTVKLDADGNATVALWGGPECLSGETLIEAGMATAPFFTAYTRFTVEAPRVVPA